MRSRVEGFSIAIILLRRLGETKSAQIPRTSLSHDVRFGARRRERFMISNWCLTDSDSAATAPRLPCLASFARVTSRWAIKMNCSRMKANFSGEGAVRKTALQKCFLPESTIRHTHVCRANNLPTILIAGRTEPRILALAARADAVASFSSLLKNNLCSKP